jgi:presenilin-like A22 family membrane protease
MSRNNRSAVTFWITPVLGVVMGLVFLAAAWSSGQPGLGVVLLGIMIVFSATLVAVSRRSETVRGLLDRRDERIVDFDLRATAATGSVLIVAVIIGALVELSRGHSGAPFTWLGAIAGVTYIVVIIIERIRR